MATLVPWSLLLIAPDDEVFGRVDYEGDSCTWPLVPSLGRPGCSFDGFAPDPTGSCLMQSEVTVWQDSDRTQWAPATGTYGDGLDSEEQKGDGTHPKILRQTSSAGAFDTTNGVTLDDDEGVVLKLFLAAPPAGSAPDFYVYLNTTLRLAFEPGAPIRLQSLVGGAWGDIAVSALGECEAYLATVGGHLRLDVLAQTDPGWTPDDSEASDAPPCQICVTINGGDDRLVIPALTLPGGHVRITGQNRQWNALVGLKRFATDCSANLAGITRPVAPEGTPDLSLTGYIPFDGAINVDAEPGDGPNQVTASLTLSVPDSGIDDTGYAVSTVYLTALTAEFPAAQTPPLFAPNWTQYLPVHTRVQFTWDQGASLARAAGEVSFIDTAGLLAPGPAGVLPAARAFRLFLGNLPEGVLPSVYNLTLVMSGYTGLRPGSGFRWRRQGSQTLVTVSLDDRLIKARKACLYMPAADGAVHYWAMQGAAHRCGFVDQDLNFPLCSKFQDGEYRLSYGTAQNPKFQPHPQDDLLGYMLQIREESGDLDASGQVLPMVLGTNAGGQLDYFAMAPGVVQSFLNPGQDPAVYGLVPEQTFSARPLFFADGTPVLNEFLQTLETVAALDQIRSEAVFEGIDLATGGAAVAWALNPQLTSDPGLSGYIGAVRSAYVQISRRISSVPVAERMAALAQVLLSFPAVRSSPIGHLNPELFILSVISIQDFAVLGSTSPVGFWATSVAHEVGTSQNGRRYGITQVGGRTLGSAGD